MPLLLVWVPPPPQVTLQGVHVLQVSQIQSKGLASEIKENNGKIKIGDNYENFPNNTIKRPSHCLS